MANRKLVWTFIFLSLTIIFTGLFLVLSILSVTVDHKIANEEDFEQGDSGHHVEFTGFDVNTEIKIQVTSKTGEEISFKVTVVKDNKVDEEYNMTTPTERVFGVSGKDKVKLIVEVSSSFASFNDLDISVYSGSDTVTMCTAMTFGCFGIFLTLPLTIVYFVKYMKIRKIEKKDKGIILKKIKEMESTIEEMERSGMDTVEERLELERLKNKVK